jgi:hypothetical protein
MHAQDIGKRDRRRALREVMFGFPGGFGAVTGSRPPPAQCRFPPTGFPRASRNA